jgi:hypothetical protein
MMQKCVERLLVRFAVMTALAGAAWPAAASTASRCDGEPAAKTLGVPRRDWQVACLRLDDSRRLIAAVPMAPLELPGAAPGARTPTAPPLILRLALAKGEEVVWRDEVRFDRAPPADLREVLAKSEEWLVGIDEQPLGSAAGVRVGVLGHWGGEPTSSMLVREIALLYRLPPDAGPLRLLWSGLGNTRESRADYCLIDGMATFQLVDDRTLERQMRIVPVIKRETTLPARRARALERGCVVKPQPARRFPVPPASAAQQP